MDVEIHPEPTEEERAAIAAAIAARLAPTDGSAWWLAGLPDEPADDDDEQSL